MSSRLTNLAALAAASATVLTLALAAAGCGSTSAAPSAARANLIARWHRVVLCARAHGMPGLADPQFDSNGRARFPANLTVPTETRQACQAMYDRLAASGGVAGPTQAELAGMLRFARCMRAHGVPDWPDPNSNGDFQLDTRLQGLLKSAIRRPLMACEQFNPDSHVRVHASRY